MLSPTPLSLFCALLLCLPLAIFFTITTPTSSTTSTTATTTTASSSGGYIRETRLTLLAIKPKTTIKIPSLPPPPPKPKLKRKPKPPPPPPSIPEDDDSLLQLAGRVNPRPKYPKKIAFMFLTTTPLPFAPLWELYFNNAKKDLFNVYVHADPSYNYTAPFTGVFSNRVIPSKPAMRLTPTLASAARRLLAYALLHDPRNGMFALLSPSCIPLHSFEFTYRVLTRSRKSFIEILPSEEWAYERYTARGDDAMLPEVKFEDFRIGSQFWVLTRKHARMIVKDRRIWGKFNLTCVVEDTCYPEENYFATLIHMRDPRGSVSATLTHVDWSNSTFGHPRMYEDFEVEPELIGRLRKSRPRYGDEEINGSDSSVINRRHRHPFLFARKFAPEAIGPLLSIAHESILKD